MKLDSEVGRITYLQKEKNFCFQWMKLLFKLEFVSIGYGFVLNEYIVKCLESKFQRSGICSFLKNFVRSLVEKYVKHTVFTDGVTWDGIQRYVIHGDSNTNYILLYRKV